MSQLPITKKRLTTATLGSCCTLKARLAEDRDPPLLFCDEAHLDLIEKALALSNVPEHSWTKRHLETYNSIRAFLKAHGREIK